MDAPTNIDELVIDTAFSFAAEKGWRALTVESVAESVAEIASLPHSAILMRFPAKALILNTFMKYIDEKVLAQELPFDEYDSDRDRIFEILMLRFEAMEPYKPALARILRDLPRDPFSIIANGPSAALSMARMLAAANLSAGGLLGIAQAHGLLCAWSMTLKVWLQDTSPDMARTMATLDKNLRRGEQLLQYIPRFRKQARPLRE
jgi:hypothetical protein